MNRDKRWQNEPGRGLILFRLARHFAKSPEWRDENVFVHGKVQPSTGLMMESPFRVCLQ